MEISNESLRKYYKNNIDKKTPEKKSVIKNRFSEVFAKYMGKSSRNDDRPFKFSVQ